MLLVEDSSADAELLVHHLNGAGLAIAWERVDTRESFRQALQDRPGWHVVLVDGKVPGILGLEAIALVDVLAPLTPVIVVSGTLEEGTAVDFLHAGARDFVTKQNLTRLAPAVRREVEQTEARRAAVRLREDQLLLAAIVASSSDAIYSLAPDGLILSWNASAVRLFGYTEAEAIGQHVAELVGGGDPGLGPRRSVRRNRILAGERVPPFEALRRRKDGSEIHVEITLSPVLSDGGEIIGVSASARDLTSERLAAESDAAFRAIFEAAGDAIAIQDDERRFIEVNDAACELLGLAREDVIGMNPVDIIQHEDAAEAWATFLIEGRRSGSLRVRRPDGEIRFAEYNAVANIQEGRHLSIVRDITDRRRTEELEAQLHEAQKMESIGRLAGGVAHDFNNILTAILGYGDIALGELEDDQGKLRNCIQEIRRASERAAQLTQQLLAFSRRQTLEREPVDLNAIAAEFGPMLSRLLGDDIQAVLELTADHTWVIADRSQLGQVIMNLAVNARDAMPGGGTLRLSTAARVCGGEDFVVLEVSDTGTGMDAAMLETIFEPFFTTKPIGEGTGLGLSTVLGVIEQSGGTVTVASKLGEGSTFTIALPSTGVGSVPASPEPSSAVGGSERILLVEDEPAVRDLVFAMLTDYGYDVAASATPETALQVAREAEPFDLIITDVVMPEMNGRELSTKLLDLHPHAKVLFISGFTGDVMIERGVLPETAWFLQKPFTIIELASSVRKALGAASERLDDAAVG